MTPEELFELISQQWSAQIPGKFKLKKGLFGGKYIGFDTYLTIQPRVKVKNNVVTVYKVEIQNKTGGVDIKAASQAIKAVKEGGIMNAAMGGIEYFINVCEEVERILGDKIAE